MKNSKISNQRIQIKQRKAEKSNRVSKRKKKIANIQKQMKANLVFMVYKTIHHYFPDLFDKLREIDDYRKGPDYDLAEIITACLVMFLFKEGSRNALNNERNEEKFKENYKKIFKMNLPHMDTVDIVMRVLDVSQIEKIKVELVKSLIVKKVFYKYKFLGKYYKVAVDATHVMNVNEGHCDHCLYRTSKNGKVTYFHTVLEAKLIAENGFCISLATEWIENPEGGYDKQDCELKAFMRLAKNLKKSFPKLEICIIADGLYPNESFFKVCKENKWRWIVTFKDGNLKTVWANIMGAQEITDRNTFEETTLKKGRSIHHKHTWLNDIPYHEFNLNWFECVETIKKTEKRFVYVTDLKIERQTVLEMTKSGRMRWKIENEGFNIQKNNGYNLGHKFSRKSMNAFKNYYQCMQIAHMINQFFELGSLIKTVLVRKITIKHLWKKMLSGMREKTFNVRVLKELLAWKTQIRFT